MWLTIPPLTGYIQTKVTNTFLEKLTAKWKEGKFVCVGLDQALFDFNKKIIDQTADLVCAYKPNLAFYEAEGVQGWKALQKTAEYIIKKYPDIVLILDAKVADIGSTNLGYTKAIFDDLKADAVTVNPYPGKEALEPFLKYKDKGIIVWLKTSNPGAGEFQDLIIEDVSKKLYQVIAEHIAKDWNKNGNCAVVVGATYPEELKEVREIIRDIPILIPGVGAQGGDLEATVKAGRDSRGWGIIISSSRGIILAPSPRDAALKLHEDIVGFLKS